MNFRERNHVRNLIFCELKSTKLEVLFMALFIFYQLVIAVIQQSSLRDSQVKVRISDSQLIRKFLGNFFDYLKNLQFHHLFVYNSLSMLLMSLIYLSKLFVVHQFANSLNQTMYQHCFCFQEQPSFDFWLVVLHFGLILQQITVFFSLEKLFYLCKIQIFTEPFSASRLHSISSIKEEQSSADSGRYISVSLIVVSEHQLTNQQSIISLIITQLDWIINLNRKKNGKNLDSHFQALLPLSAELSVQLVQRLVLCSYQNVKHILNRRAKSRNGNRMSQNPLNSDTPQRWIYFCQGEWMISNGLNQYQLTFISKSICSVTLSISQRRRSEISKIPPPEFQSHCSQLYYILILSMIQNDYPFKNNGESSNHPSSSHIRKYTVTTYQERLQLIELVQNYGFSIYKASQQLGINNSTAKVILRQYRRAGHIFRKKSETRTPQVLPKNRKVISESTQRSSTQPQEIERREETELPAVQMWLPFISYQSFEAYGFNMLYNLPTFY